MSFIGVREFGVAGRGHAIPLAKTKRFSNLCTLAHGACGKDPALYDVHFHWNSQACELDISSALWDTGCYTDAVQADGTVIYAHFEAKPVKQPRRVTDEDRARMNTWLKQFSQNFVMPSPIASPDIEGLVLKTRAENRTQTALHIPRKMQRDKRRNKGRRRDSFKQNSEVAPSMLSGSSGSVLIHFDFHEALPEDLTTIDDGDCYVQVSKSFALGEPCEKVSIWARAFVSECFGSFIDEEGTECQKSFTLSLEVDRANDCKSIGFCGYDSLLEFLQSTEEECWRDCVPKEAWGTGHVGVGRLI